MTTEATKPVLKPQSKAEIILWKVVYGLAFAFIVQWLFNNCIASVYDIKELPYKLAYLISIAGVFSFFWVKHQIRLLQIYRSTMIQEAVSTRLYAHYILEYTMFPPEKTPSDIPVDKE